MADEESLYAECVKHWGEGSQIVMVIEECAELIVNIAKFLNKRGVTMMDLVKEAVDVEVMLDQLKYIFRKKGYSRFFLDFKKQRLKRVERMLNKP